MHVSRRCVWEVSPVRVRRRPREEGQGLMEFALVAPFLLILVFGVFDFGRGMSANVTVANSSREGARYMAASSSTSTSAAPNYYGFGDCPLLVGGVATSPSAGGTLKAWRQLQADNLTLTNVQFIAYFYNTDPNGDSNHVNAKLTLTCPADQSSTVPAVSPALPSYTPQTLDWVIFEIKYSYKPSTPLISAFVHNGVVSLDQLTTMVLD